MIKTSKIHISYVLMKGTYFHDSLLIHVCFLHRYLFFITYNSTCNTLYSRDLQNRAQQIEDRNEQNAVYQLGEK